MRTHMLLVPVLLFAVACSDSTAPVRPLVGQWGGADAALSADSRQVHIEAGCSAFGFVSAIVPDAAGNFRLLNGRMVTFGAGSIPATARGRIVGDAMTLTITTTTAQGTFNATYQLERGAPYAPTSYCMLA